MIEDDKKIHDVCNKPFERNNYYFGKLMRAQDFKTEQSYFNKKRWLINKRIHGRGVVCGLDVEVRGELGRSDKVIITPGLAIDCFGREILVCEPRDVSLKPEEAECNNEEQAYQNEGGKYAICIKFKECMTECYPVLSGACDQKEKYEYNYIKDWYEVKVIPFLEDADIKPFCPKKYSCADDNESQKKSLHECICDWLCNCPESHDPQCDPQCVVLATVTLDRHYNIQEIDKFSNRKLVYNNRLLYDLISCYHGDLPRVCKISWDHDKALEWEDFETLVDNGLEVTFNQIMKHDTINEHTFRITAITVGDGGYRLLRYIPIQDRKIEVRDEIETHDDFEVIVTKATFNFEKGWIGEEVKTSDGPVEYSSIVQRAKFEILLRGSSIFSKYGKSLDGCFMGDLPSGTGTQGSDFFSWFSVKPRHGRKRKNSEEEKLPEEEINEY